MEVFWLRKCNFTAWSLLLPLFLYHEFSYHSEFLEVVYKAVVCVSQNLALQPIFFYVMYKIILQIPIDMNK